MGGIAWTEEEDHLLKKCIEQYGEGKWHRVPQLAGLNRCRKSCRLRWLNYLRPNIKRGSFSQDEVELIVKLHKLLGNRWSLIAARLPGRTANDVKNYWNCHLSKKLNAQSGECDMNGDHDHAERQSSSSSCNNYNEESIIRSWTLPGSSSPRKLHQKACAPYDQYTMLTDEIIVPAQEESCSTFTTTTMLYMDDHERGVPEQNNAFHDVQHVIKYPDAYMDPQQAGFAADELPVNFHVDQQVKAMPMPMPIAMMVDNRYNSWEWDDLISEMDIWNE